MRVLKRGRQISMSHVTHDQLRWNSISQLASHESMPQVVGAERWEANSLGCALEASIDPLNALTGFCVAASSQVFEYIP